MRVVDAESVLRQIAGAQIESGEETFDGVTLRLADGRHVIFTGEFILAISVPKKRTLQ